MPRRLPEKTKARIREHLKVKITRVGRKFAIAEKITV